MLGWLVALVLLAILLFSWLAFWGWLVINLRRLKKLQQKQKDLEAAFKLLKLQRSRSPVAKQCLDAIEDYRSFIDTVCAEIAVDTAKVSVIVTEGGDRLCAKLRAMMPSDSEMEALRDMAGRESETKKASTTIASGEDSGRGSCPSPSTSSAPIA